MNGGNVNGFGPNGPSAGDSLLFWNNAGRWAMAALNGSPSFNLGLGLVALDRTALGHGTPISPA